jgi:hypothetical protein
MTDLPILEEYWTYDEKWGAFWASLTRTEQESLLSEPPLSHPDSVHRSEKFIPGTVEKRESVARLLEAKGKSPDDTGFRVYLRLLQICGEATRACAAPNPQTALTEVLGRRVLCGRARAQFAKENVPMFFHHSSNRTIELDSARFGAKRRFLSFLAIPEGKNGIEWERGQIQLRSGGDMNYFTGLTVTTLAVRMLRHCLEADGPVALSAIRAKVCRDEKTGIFEKAIRGITQWGLAFAVLDASNNPALRLWPGMRERLSQDQRPAPPLPVADGDPVETFRTPVVVTELHGIVLAAAAAPLSLNKKALATLPAAKAKEIGSRLPETPDWVCGGLYHRPNSLQVALGLGLDLGFLESVENKRYGEPWRLTASNPGRTWATLDATARLKTILETIRKRRPGAPGSFSSNWSSYPDSGFYREAGNAEKEVHLGDALYAAWGTLPTDRWTPLEPLLDHLAVHANPIEASAGPGGVVRVARQARYSSSWQFIPTDVDLLIPEARTELEQFLTTRLVPLGAVTLGRHADGSVSVRLNEAGRFFLGLAGHFILEENRSEGKVVVQPNFEVVFLGPNLAAESTFAVFAERITKTASATTGSLFRITRASIQKAAHAGSTLEGIFKSIETSTDKPLPPNVRSEIEGWIEGRKYYRITPATLIRCPSREVALRVHSALPSATKLLSDTVLELTERITPAIRRKLEKDGLFEEEAGADGGTSYDDELIGAILRKSGMLRRGRGRR